MLFVPAACTSAQMGVSLSGGWAWRALAGALVKEAAASLLAPVADRRRPPAPQHVGLEGGSFFFMGEEWC